MRDEEEMLMRKEGRDKALSPCVRVCVCVCVCVCCVYVCCVCVRYSQLPNISLSCRI